eukprot:3323833-Prymnesium_polylepis.3
MSPRPCGRWWGPYRRKECFQTCDASHTAARCLRGRRVREAWAARRWCTGFPRGWGGDWTNG